MPDDGSEEQEREALTVPGSKFATQKEWWASVVSMRFDDPEQEPPKVFYPNHVRLALPWPGVRLMAYRAQRTVGVFIAGQPDALREMWVRLAPDVDAIVQELPPSTSIPDADAPDAGKIGTVERNETFADDDEKRTWIEKTLNVYVNTFRPRLNRLRH